MLSVTGLEEQKNAWKIRKYRVYKDESGYWEHFLKLECTYLLRSCFDNGPQRKLNLQIFNLICTAKPGYTNSSALHFCGH